MLLILIPLAAKAQALKDARFSFGVSGRSVLVLAGLGLLVAALFGYLYFREWWWEWKLRRLLNEARDQALQKPAEPLAPRPPLVKAAKDAVADARSGADAKTGSRKPAENRPAAYSLSPAQLPRARQSDSLDWPSTLSRGTVKIQAADELYELFVDGFFVGNTPAKLSLAEGVHLVEVTKLGCKDYRRELSVSAGAELTLRAVLETDDSADESVEAAVESLG